MSDALSIIPENARERIEISLTEWHGFSLFSARVYASTGDGGWVPTTKGLTIRVEQLPELARAVAEAERTARALGQIQ
jgi:hypothetical protein